MNQQANIKYEFEDLKQIVKEGWMDKQSRFLKKWHKRWVVLTNFTLYTFKKQQQYNNPTEVIDLNLIVSIKQADDQELQKVNSILSKMSNSNNSGSTSQVVTCSNCRIKLNCNNECQLINQFNTSNFAYPSKHEFKHIISASSNIPSSKAKQKSKCHLFKTTQTCNIIHKVEIQTHNAVNLLTEFLHFPQSRMITTIIDCLDMPKSQHYQSSWSIHKLFPQQIQSSDNQTEMIRSVCVFLYCPDNTILRVQQQCSFPQ